MEKYLIPIADTDLDNVLSNIIATNFEVTEDVASKWIKEKLKPHLDRFKSDLSIIIETDYVDKVYRDSFYLFYASKLTTYKRDCIKLSFFEGSEQFLTLKSFKQKEVMDEYRDKYRGFLVLRPTLPYIVGRSALSPLIFNKNSFKTCLTRIPSSVLGVSFEVEAFPYSSQDTETISCAETMIWALMEYFSNKYSEYRSILPSTIHQVLKNNIVERQLPSAGLSIDSICYMVKECGFGPKLYSKEEFKDSFSTLLSCYVESGIPIIIALDNLDGIKNGKAQNYIGHAVLCVGHKDITPEQIDRIVETKETTEKGVNIFIQDWDSIEKDFVFIDDNYPAYQTAALNKPTGHYREEDWKACKISHFIVPLYKKIYSEAYIAKHFVKTLILSNYFSLSVDRKVTIRTFLCATRSYREYIALGNIDEDLKDTILKENLPKYIWVAELSNQEYLKQDKAQGIVLLDATEKNECDYSSLLIALFNGTLLKYNRKKRIPEPASASYQPFNMFHDNLK